MFCRFDSRRLGHSRAGSAPTAVVQPLEPVLARLIGRPVTLLVGRRSLSGKLVRSSPPTLTSPQGQVTVVVDMVKSVAF